MDRIKHSFHKVKKDIEELRERLNKLEKVGVEPFTLWLTGLPCSGKTTIAKELERIMKDKGYKIASLDGDAVRKGLSSDLDFSDKGIRENLRRVSHVAQIFNEKGNIVVASFVSPKEEHRSMVKNNVKNIKMIYVKCSLKECEKRDVKGMYKKARKGEIKNFIGISYPFEEPDEFTVDTEKMSVEEAVDKILKYLDLS